MVKNDRKHSKFKDNVNYSGLTTSTVLYLIRLVNFDMLKPSEVLEMKTPEIQTIFLS